jgi:hypothetical protein
MRTLALPLFITVVVISACVLSSRPVQSLGAGIHQAVTHPVSESSCVRAVQRVCGAHGCAWRTVCRR